MKKVNLLPNFITAFGLTCGLFVIFKMSMVEVGGANYHTLLLTTIFLVLAVFADILDGWTARLMKAESEFGGFFDSLADAVTFGVAPSVIILKTLSIDPEMELAFWLTASLMVFSVCGILRLVRFNVASQHAKEDSELMTAHKKNFTGLPIPGAAAAAISANLFFISPEFASRFALLDETRGWILSAMMLFLGYLMVCRLKFPSLKTLRFKVASFRLVFLTVILAVFIFFGILHHFAVVFFFASWLYIAIALTLTLIRLISGKRSKRLEDFEPEPEIQEEDDDSIDDMS